MSSEKQYTKKIPKELISLTAEMAAANVPGVNTVKEVKTVKDKNILWMDIYLTVDFGVKIPQLAWDVQDAVKVAVTALKAGDIETINIHIQGVEMTKEGKKL